MKDLIVENGDTLIWAGGRIDCVIGRGGLIPAADKREGDGATPIGTWSLRQLFYRPDRFAAPPQTSLPIQALTPNDGWCDAPEDLAYNCFVTHPHPTSAERLWRDDHVYDLIVTLSHNDDPVVPGLGSAIFFHLTQPDRRPTEGCIAIAQDDMLAVLETVDQGNRMIVKAP